VIDRAVGVGQEDGQGQIMVKGKPVDIHLVDVDDADADVVRGRVPEALRGTDNLPVEQTPVYSRLAPENDQHRFVVRGREGARLIEIGDPWKTFRHHGPQGL